MNAMMLALLLIGAAQADELDEVVVTASRQGIQSLQKIPASITVVDLKAEGRLGATDLSDVANSIPSLTIEQGGPGLNKIDIRGITVEKDRKSTRLNSS